MTYDANGSLLTMADGCGTTTYTWDVRNRLTGISGYKPDCTSLTASFKYDAIGRRTERTINGVTTQYLYDGLDITQEIVGGAKTNYIRTLNIDEPLTRIKADGTVRHYVTDALGSVIALTDDTGAVKTTYTYDAFGNVTVSGESSDNPIQFVGKENDGTGLMREGYRYYSSDLQRYISEDPIGFAGGDVNYYARVGNNPIRYKDPLGLAYIDINFSFGWRGIGLTGGVLFGDNGKVYPYGGVGFMNPGGSVSLTTSQDNPTLGWNVGLQGARGMAYQKGISISGDVYTEWGIGWPGLAATSYYVFNPFDPNKQSNPSIQLAKCH